ncbi:MAG: hypothetical protein JO327_03800 [Nitrososphaeraceae archaeon]|nr:hypothetical protein [Nitrososphaeraceae archaeon]MBV9667235.1 hypothetical protein [Nitrososphaeraceae archaeon]
MTSDLPAETKNDIERSSCSVGGLTTSTSPSIPPINTLSIYASASIATPLGQDRLRKI